MVSTAKSSTISPAISAADLARTLGSSAHPLIIDVRREPAFQASAYLLCGGMTIYDAFYRWQRDLGAEQHSWPPQDALGTASAKHAR